METPLCDVWRLADGQLLMVRGATRADVPAVQAFIGRLSLQSRYRRFFYAARELTPPMQRQFTRANPKVEMSLLAVVVDEQGHETLVGTAQYAVTRWPDLCEFAVVVADDWQRKGIARRLLRDLVGVATVAGLQSIQGDTLADNEAIRRLLLQMGFRFERHADGPLLRRAVRALDAARNPEPECEVLAQVAKIARGLPAPSLHARV
jgi:acetyltransferase